MQDILNANENFLTYGEFVNRFNISTNYLHYFQLIAAVPNNLKKKATQNPIPLLDVSAKVVYNASNELVIDLSEARCKNHYYLFSNNEKFVVPSGILKWQEKFPEKIDDWRQKLQTIYNSTRDNKLRQFSFRLFHRTLITKKELKLYNLAKDDKCFYCLDSDSIEHTFIHCSYTKTFYLQAIS